MEKQLAAQKLDNWGIYTIDEVIMESEIPQ
jgi:hypothetical protein